MSVGDSIRFFRKKAGLSQEELADILHIKKQTLSGYERGTREVRVSVLKDIAGALGVPAYRFMAEDVCGNNKAAGAEDVDLNEYRVIITGMNTNVRKVALEQMRALANLEVITKH